MSNSQTNLRSSVVDDRDRVYDPVDWQVAHAHGKLAGWPFWILPAIGCPGGLVIVVMFAYDVNVFSLQAPLREIMSISAIMCWCGVLFLIANRLKRTRSSAQRVEPAMLSIGRCPGCNYVLAGLIPEADNCIQCPECGAAWKADRVGKPPRP